MSKQIEVKQCDWCCPICGKRCGGCLDHNRSHECPEHFPPKKKEEDDD